MSWWFLKLKFTITFSSWKFFIRFQFTRQRSWLTWRKYPIIDNRKSIAESHYVELNLPNDKMVHKLHIQFSQKYVENHLKILRENLDLYSSSYEIILSGYLIVGFEDRKMKSFSEIYNFKSHKAASMVQKLKQSDLYRLNTIK